MTRVTRSYGPFSALQGPLPLGRLRLLRRLLQQAVSHGPPRQEGFRGLGPPLRGRRLAVQGALGTAAATALAATSAKDLKSSRSAAIWARFREFLRRRWLELPTSSLLHLPRSITSSCHWPLAPQRHLLEPQNSPKTLALPACRGSSTCPAGSLFTGSGAAPAQGYRL